MSTVTAKNLFYSKLTLMPLVWLYRGDFVLRKPSEPFMVNQLTGTQP